MRNLDKYELNGRTLRVDFAENEKVLFSCMLLTTVSFSLSLPLSLLFSAYEYLGLSRPRQLIVSRDQLCLRQIRAAVYYSLSLPRVCVCTV
jgi:hypothetical protein